LRVSSGVYPDWLLARQSLERNRHPHLRSGSTGATNVWRAAGKTAGLTVFFIDVLKGYLPVAGSVYLDNFLLPEHLELLLSAPDTSHSGGRLPCRSQPFDILKIPRSKSAATGLGTLLALSPLGGMATFLTWIFVVKTTRWVSLASILGVGSCAFWFKLFGAPNAFIGFCVFGFIYVTYRHKANIKRMLNGTEPKVGDKPVVTDGEKESPPGNKEEGNPTVSKTESPGSETQSQASDKEAVGDPRSDTIDSGKE